MQACDTAATGRTDDAEECPPKMCESSQIRVLYSNSRTVTVDIVEHVLLPLPEKQTYFTLLHC